MLKYTKIAYKIIYLCIKWGNFRILEHPSRCSRQVVPTMVYDSTFGSTQLICATTAMTIQVNIKLSEIPTKHLEIKWSAFHWNPSTLTSLGVGSTTQYASERHIVSFSQPKTCGVKNYK